MNRSQVKLMRQYKEDAAVYKRLFEVYKARTEEIAQFMRDGNVEEAKTTLYELVAYDLEFELAVRDKIIQGIKKGVGNEI